MYWVYHRPGHRRADGRSSKDTEHIQVGYQLEKESMIGIFQFIYRPKDLLKLRWSRVLDFVQLVVHEIHRLHVDEGRY